jgi:hypothetical protein
MKGTDLYRCNICACYKPECHLHKGNKLCLSNFDGETSRETLTLKISDMEGYY